MVQNCAARELETEAGRISDVVTEKGGIRASAVLVAGGAWSGMFLRHHGIRFLQACVKSPSFYTVAAPAVTDGGIAMEDVTIRRRLDVLGLGHFGHRQLVFHGLFVLLERSGHEEDHLAVLDRGDAAYGEAAAVARAVDLVDDRRGDIAGAQEIGVQRMRAPRCQHRGLRGRERLTEHLSAEIVVEPVEVELQHPVSHLRDNSRRQGNLVRVAAHERDPMLVRCAGHGVTAQQHAAPVSPHKVSDRATGEVAANSMEHHSWEHLGLLLPDCDHRIISLDPLPVGRLHVDRHAAESVRPFDLHPEHVRMAGRNRSHPTQLLNGRNQVVVEVPVRIPQQVAQPRLD